MSKTQKRKTFIVDTNVLLYDKTSIHSFPGAKIILPLTVLDELDRLSTENGGNISNDTDKNNN